MAGSACLKEIPSWVWQGEDPQDPLGGSNDSWSGEEAEGTGRGRGGNILQHQSTRLMTHGRMWDEKRAPEGSL